LGNGFLARSIDSLDDGDFRRNSPRFRGENLKVNQSRFAPLRDMAETVGVTPAQPALAWLLHQGDDIVPIPGTRTPAHLASNVAAAHIQLDQGTLRRIDEIAPRGLAEGATLLA
jgi:aryl-alcohol dehydrogenase-like predicted oxidoreductase